MSEPKFTQTLGETARVHGPLRSQVYYSHGITRKLSLFVVDKLTTAFKPLQETTRVSHVMSSKVDYADVT